MRSRRAVGRRPIAAWLEAITIGTGCIVLLSTSCNDPQGPAAPATNTLFRGQFAGGQLEFRIDAPSGVASDLTLVASDLQYDSATHELHAQIGIRNDGSSPVPGPASVEVFGFVPADVVPLNAVCSGDSLTPPVDRHCDFDHHGTYGEDGVLDPGETSASVEWILLVPSGEGFAFRARLGEPEPGLGVISGVVFADLDRNGRRDANEPGLQGIGVHLSFGARQTAQRTDAEGHYRFTVGEPGLFELTLDPAVAASATAPLPLQVTILRRSDGTLSSFTLGDIGLARDNGAPPSVQCEGFAFEDLDRDGIRDEGEPGIVGVKIRGEACEQDDKPLDDDAGDVGELEVRTDADGHWVLQLPACGGPWSVSGESLDDYDRTTPKKVLFEVAPPAGEILHADFGYAPEDSSSHYEIRGTVYLDRNRNGLRDADEPGIAGVAVSAQGLSCEAPTKAIDRTDSKGRYDLDGDDVACPLPWQVTREAIPGQLGTTADAVELDAPPASGHKYVVDFGVAPPEGSVVQAPSGANGSRR
jgi:SdrD B-like domain